MAQLLFFVSIFAVLSTGFCTSCSSFEITSKSFTTQDATIVSNIAFISEFSVKCGSGEIDNLYAELDGNIAPVSIVGPNQFQVSWTEEVKSTRAIDKVIRLFDEEGYTAYRKTLRAGDDVSAVPALFNVVVNHPGTFMGPWFKSEFVATVSFLSIAYFAMLSRSQIASS